MPQGNVESSAASGGTYLYAVASGLTTEGLTKRSGVRDSKVYAVAADDLVAVVSDLPSREELRPERRHLAAHQQVLTDVVGASRVVLPVSFGTVAESADSVRRLLERYRDTFNEQMQRVIGRVEVGLRLYYSAFKPSLFEYLVSKTPDLQAMRDQMVQSGRSASREEKIDLGQKVDEALTAMRDEYAARLEDAVRSVSDDLRRNPPRNEQDIARVACLLPKNRQSEFDTAVREAAPQFPGVFSMEQSGPFPPYDFVDLHLKEV